MRDVDRKKGNHRDTESTEGHGEEGGLPIPPFFTVNLCALRVSVVNFISGYYLHCAFSKK
jgi:hypothetical protein